MSPIEALITAFNANGALSAVYPGGLQLDYGPRANFEAVATVVDDGCEQDDFFEDDTVDQQTATVMLHGSAETVEKAIEDFRAMMSDDPPQLSQGVIVLWRIEGSSRRRRAAPGESGQQFFRIEQPVYLEWARTEGAQE